ncbi:MAG: hypothetical protein HQ446_11355 [Polaromonas sp.]|nr:hypothetical protein [Polaromonas sp.]
MKYALVIGLILLVFWLWRSTRQAGMDDKKPGSIRPKTDSSIKATEIVACEVCRVHLPRNEALTGSRGLYCSTDHRQQAGD